MSVSIKNLYLSIILLTTCICSCKTKKDPSKSKGENPHTSLQEAIADNTPTIIGLINAQQNSSEQIILSPSPSFHRLSPLLFLNTQQLIEHGDVVDFSRTGLLVSLGHTPIPERGCLNISIITSLRSSQARHQFLVAQNNPIPENDSAGGEDLGFEYCMEQNQVKIYVASDIASENFKEYLAQRGFASSNAAGLNLGLNIKSGNIARRAEPTNVGRSSADSMESRNLQQSSAASPQVDSSNLRRADTDGAIDRQMTLGQRDIGANAASSQSAPVTRMDNSEFFGHFASLRKQAFVKQIDSNATEADIFARLEKEGKVLEGIELGRGSYATVKKVVIDGKEYAMRVESLLNSRGRVDRFRLESAYRERASFLFNNDLNEAYPDAGLLRSASSFITANYRFITLSELGHGGDLSKLIDNAVNNNTTVPLALREEFFKQLRKQMLIYRKGITESHNGQATKVRWEFIHGDIKPNNIMITKDQKVGFVDFGFSRIIRIDESGAYPAYYELIPTATSSKLVPLVVDDFPGTPSYVSPEVLLQSRSGNKAKGGKAYRILRNADAHAFNTSMLELNTGRIVFDYDSRKAGGNIIEAVYEDILKSVPAKFQGERTLIKSLPTKREDILTAQHQPILPQPLVVAQQPTVR